MQTHEDSPPHGAARAGSDAEISNHAIVLNHVHAACDGLGVGDDVRRVLTTPAREARVQLPLRTRDGRVRVHWGYRVQHSGARGPYSGGVRFHPGVDLDEMRALASLATWKTALAGIPFGGAAGGIDVAVQEVNADETQALTRSFVGGIGELLGPNRDVLGPDVDTDARVMAWMVDEYGRAHGHTPAVATGKPLALEGSAGGEAAPGRGIVYVFREAAPSLGLTPPQTSVVVQGFGQVGSHAARLLHQLGCRIVGVADAAGAVASSAGLDPAALAEHVDAGATVPEFAGEGVERISHAELLALECDVFLAAALGGMINEGNADDLACRVLIEGASTPTTPAAEEILTDRGTVVLPDVLAGVGGSIASYFEWVQNLQHARWDEREVNDRLGSIMRRSYRTTLAHARDSGDIPLRMAAYELAVQRVLEAARARGQV